MKGMGRKISIMLLAAAAVALSCGSALAGWNITDLATMGNITYATGISINNNGDIVGKAQFAGSNFTHAALWRNGVATDLGVLTNLSGSERISIQP